MDTTTIPTEIGHNKSNIYSKLNSNYINNQGTKNG